MDTGMNTPQGEGFDQNIEPQYDLNTEPQYEEGYYIPVYRKPWFWIIIAAVLACAAVVTILLISGPGPKSFELTGNAGVVAAYDFLSEQQSNQNKLTGALMKELGERLAKEPFEIESELGMDMGDTVSSYLPLDNITLGIDAKYDMKDFGVKISALGMEVLGAYLIEDNVVVSLVGRTGSMPVEVPEGVNITKNMSLKDRIKTFLPFLPEDDEIYLAILQKAADSIPDKYTVTDTAQVYSPKDDKEVRMDVITTTLDQQALKDVIGKFAGELKDDKKLSRQIQDTIDSFTDFAGLESLKIDEVIKEIEDSADSDVLKDIKISWSVYRRDDSYVGINVDISGPDTTFKYTYICEFDGNDMYSSTSEDINGVTSKSENKTTWQDNKIRFKGESDTKISEGTGNSTYLIEGSIEFTKPGGDEYAIAGDFTLDGDAFNDILNSGKGMSYDMKLDATIKVGGGLGTLKEDRDWDDIYKEEWGKMEDILKYFSPSGSLFNYDNGNTL